MRTLLGIVFFMLASPAFAQEAGHSGGALALLAHRVGLPADATFEDVVALDGELTRIAAAREDGLCDEASWPEIFRFDAESHEPAPGRRYVLRDSLSFAALYAAGADTVNGELGQEKEAQAADLGLSPFASWPEIFRARIERVRRMAAQELQLPGTAGLSDIFEALYVLEDSAPAPALARTCYGVPIG